LIDDFIKRPNEIIVFFFFMTTRNGNGIEGCCRVSKNYPLYQDEFIWKKFSKNKKIYEKHM